MYWALLVNTLLLDAIGRAFVAKSKLERHETLQTLPDVAISPLARAHVLPSRARAREHTEEQTLYIQTTKYEKKNA